MPSDELPIVGFATKEEFAAWLDASHSTVPGLWLKYAKKASGIESITHAEAVEVALRYGWIDGQGHGIDDRFWRVRFKPRARRSRWSKINRTTAERLIEAGEMMPAGLREVAAARADGRWEAAYASASQATVPDDLRAALDASPAATAFFETLNSRNRYAILHRVEEAKREETRARRITKYVAMCEANEKIHP